MLKDETWKYDIVPEFMDGKNIADFVDPDILQRLDELEKEEEMLEQQRGDMEEEDEVLDEDMMEAYGEVRNKQALKKIEHNMKKRQRAHGKNKDVEEAAEKMEELGIDTEKFRERIKNQKKQEKLSTLVKRKHAELESDEDAMLDEQEEQQQRASRNFENRVRS